MFDIEKALSEWRVAMGARGMNNVEALAELESHLREEYSRQIALGVAASLAWTAATVAIGDARELTKEFKKLWSWRNKYVFAGLSLLASMNVLLMVFLAGHTRGWLLETHILLLVSGYVAIFWAAALAGVWILAPRFSSVDSAKWFVGFGMLLILLGVVAGIPFRHEGSRIGSEEYYGALSSLIWLSVIFLLQQRRGRASERFSCVLCLVGSFKVTLAWFAPYVLERPLTPWYWLLAGVLGANLCLMLIAMLRKEQTAIL